jgi:predicted acetyltransferase
MSTVEVTTATPDDREALRQLVELYAYDFSEFNRADVDADGRYGYRYFDAIWTEPERHALLVRVDGVLAGFAIVRTGDPHDMAEFFIMRKYRRSGVGRNAARAVFARFPGPWQTRQQFENAGATKFWRRAIPVAFEEADNAAGPVQRFVIP